MSFLNSPGQPPAYPPAPPSGLGESPTRLRGRTPRRLGWIFLVLGIALIIGGVFIIAKQSVDKVNNFERVKVSAGAGTINFAKTGNYVAYYEASNVDSNISSVPAVRVAIQSPSGKARELTDLYGGRSDGKVKIITYNYNGHNGVALYQFKITEKGTYKVQLQGSTNVAPDAQIAFGTSIAGGLALGAGLLIPGILLLIAAIILLIVGYVKRSRHKKELAARSYGGYPQQPPPGAYPQQQPAGYGQQPAAYSQPPAYPQQQGGYPQQPPPGNYPQQPGGPPPAEN